MQDTHAYKIPYFIRKNTYLIFRHAAEFAEKIENLDEAEQLWSELLAREEAMSVHWEGLARTCLRRGDTEKACEALQQAISLDSEAIWTMILA
jgi:tetratricopeptide (TPR) repeat protein